jgi:protein SCO1/2
MKKFEIFIKKTVLLKKFWITFIGLMFLIPFSKSLTRKLPPDPPVLWELPNFELRDENGEVFTRDNLMGQMTIVHFFFTSCPTVCPRLIQSMSIIQKRVRGLGNKVKILSVSIDSVNDNQDQLFKYARKVRANPYIWKFLNGEEEKMRKFIGVGFKSQISEKNKVGINSLDLVHSERIFLVDYNGGIRGIFFNNKVSLDELIVQLGLMVNRNIAKMGVSNVR